MTLDERNALILSHRWLVELLVSKLKRKLWSADVDELRAVGNLALVEAGCRFQGKCKFSTYAGVVVAGAMFKSFVRVDKGGRIVWCVLSDLMIAEEPSPEVQALRAERKCQVVSAFSRLKPRHQRVLWLVYVEEQTKNKIATEWGWKYHRVVKAERSAINQLRNRVLKTGRVFNWNTRPVILPPGPNQTRC